MASLITSNKSSSLRKDRSSVDSQKVIIEIGSAYTKCGYVGEATPRRIIRNPKLLTRLMMGHFRPLKEQHLERVIQSFLSLFHNVIYDVLFTSLDRLSQLFISLNIFAIQQEIIRKLISDAVLRMKFSSEFKSEEIFSTYSLQFLTTQYCSIACTDQESGLIVDVGYSETRIVPVCFGREVIYGVRITPVGSYHVLQRLKTSVLDHNPNLLAQNLLCYSTDDKSDDSSRFECSILEDILTRMCYCLPLSMLEESKPTSKPTPWPRIDITKEKQRLRDHTERKISTAALPALSTPRNNHRRRIPRSNYQYFDYYVDDSIIKVEKSSRWVPLEILFEGDDQGKNIVDHVLDSLMAVEVDVRARLCENLVLCGGCTMIPGFAQRFAASLKEQIKNEKYNAIQKSADNIRVFQPSNIPQVCHSWTGASISCASIQESNNFELIKQQHQSTLKK